MNVLKEFAKKVKEEVSKVTVEDVACAALGSTAALAVVCGWQAGQIGELNKKVNRINESMKNICDIAYANDCRSFNNHVISAAAIDAIVDSLKGTHPGIKDAVMESVKAAKDNYFI